jgi:hypothetical protein
VSDRKLYDSDVIESIALVIIAGLSPGSFGKACMALDKDRAYQCAHRALHPDSQHSQGQDIVANMLEFCEEHLPGHLQGDYQALQDWEDQGGLLGADDSTRLMLRLQNGKHAWYLKKIKPKFRPWAQGIPDSVAPAQEGMIWMPRVF